MSGEVKYIKINGRELKSPLVLASMSGITDADYVLEREKYVGAAFLGGYNTDEITRNASKEVENTGRKEFSCGFDEIASELEKLKGKDIIVGLNLRGNNPESFLSAARRFGKDIIYEIDAHCRQKPMTDVGCGQHLLEDTETLCKIVSALSSESFTVSVKTRAGIADDKDLAVALWKAGAKILHIDLMDFGYSKVRQIRNSCPITIIANNGVTDPDKMMDYFSHGADLVSLARGADPSVLSALLRFIEYTAESVGWYNAPKQLCRGGDLRSLAFCCMPVKQCPLLPALDKINMDRDFYTKLKLDTVKDNLLSQGSHTCFGSLAFCCKSSTPCMFRDMTLMNINLEKNEYMKLKRSLSEKLLAEVWSQI